MSEPSTGDQVSLHSSVLTISWQCQIPWISICTAGWQLGNICAHSLLKQQLHSRQLLGTNLFMFDFANSGLCYLWSKILTFEERVLREGPCVGSKSPGRIVLKDALCMRVAGICWKSAIQPSIVYANQPSQQCKSFGTVKGKSSESERNSRAWLKPI